MADIKIHRSKGIVERNMPRWFRKQGFKPFDDFQAFFRSLPADADATVIADWKEVEEKGDDASPKGLLRLMKYYNKHRKFSKTDIAPPWYFVEANTRTDLPADDAWTIDLSTNLDHERGQRNAAQKAQESRTKSDRRKAVPAEGGAPAAAAHTEDAPPPEPQVTGVVPPPSTDKSWSDALRRLPGAIQLLVDGRGKNVSELNDRRKRAMDLVQIDRIHNLARHGAELRKQVLEWFAEKRRDNAEVEAEIKTRLTAIEDWVKTHLESARKLAPELDDHAVEELKGRVRRLYPKLPDEAQLQKLVKQALEAARPKKLESWAKKVLDDFNNSRGSAAEKVRDPWLLDGLLRWLSTRPSQDTPTDGEIYDQIQKMGGPNLAARKKRNEGPRPPKQPERRGDRHPNEDEPEEKAPPAQAKPAKQG